MQNKTAVDPLKHRKDWLGLVKATQTDKITSPTDNHDSLSSSIHCVNQRRHTIIVATLTTSRRCSNKNYKKKCALARTCAPSCTCTCTYSSTSSILPYYPIASSNSPETTELETPESVQRIQRIHNRFQSASDQQKPKQSQPDLTVAPNLTGHPSPTCSQVMVGLSHKLRLFLLLLVIFVVSPFPGVLIIAPVSATGTPSAPSPFSQSGSSSNNQRRHQLPPLQSPDVPFASRPSGTLKDKLTFNSKSSSYSASSSRHSATSGNVFAAGSVRNTILPEFLQTIHSKATIDGRLVTPYKEVNEIKVFPDKSGSGNKYTFSFAVSEIEAHETAIALEVRFYTKFKVWTNPKQRVYIYHILPLGSSSHKSSSNSEDQHSDKQKYLASFVAEHIIDYLSTTQQVIQLDPSLVSNRSKSNKKQKILFIITTDPLPDVVIDNPNLFTSKHLHESLVRNSDEVPLRDRSLLVIYIKDALNVVEPHELQVYSTVKPLLNQATEALEGGDFSRYEEEAEKNGEDGYEGEDEEDELLRRRRKRSMGSIGYKMNPCRLVPFVANFTEIGWTKEFVIGPETFEMNLCMGECPWPNDQRYNATNHAIMQGTFSAYNSYVGRTKVPQPCCVPDKLLPLPLLYMEPSQNVILKTFRDMVAAHCGCY